MTSRSKRSGATRTPRAKLKSNCSARAKTLADRLTAIAKDCARRLTPETRTIDHGELLYDEHGLPRSD